jgi:putative ABC transport system ATP-binding protein
MKLPLLRTRGIRKDYWDGDQAAHVLRGIDLTVGHGEFLAIQGPSGCGKSTLLHILGLMMPPTAAEVLEIDGADCLRLSERKRTTVRRQKIGFVFQRFNLLPTVSARGNIELALRLRGASLDGQAEAALDAVGLNGLAHRKPGQLSIGEQQRVAIARAVACEPALLLADEPTGNLDSANAEVVLARFRWFHETRGLTIVMITHDSVCASAADRVLHMKDGLLEPVP